MMGAASVFDRIDTRSSEAAGKQHEHGTLRVPMNPDATANATANEFDLSGNDMVRGMYTSEYDSLFWDPPLHSTSTLNARAKKLAKASSRTMPELQPLCDRNPIKMPYSVRNVLLLFIERYLCPVTRIAERAQPGIMSLVCLCEMVPTAITEKLPKSSYSGIHPYYYDISCVVDEQRMAIQSPRIGQLIKGAYEMALACHTASEDSKEPSALQVFDLLDADACEFAKQCIDTIPFYLSVHLNALKCSSSYTFMVPMTRIGIGNKQGDDILSTLPWHNRTCMEVCSDQRQAYVFSIENLIANQVRSINKSVFSGVVSPHDKAAQDHAWCRFRNTFRHQLDGLW
jgi:hypothetical protein